MSSSLISFTKPIAEIAQLVEHNLAKVGVASSSLVFRSRQVIRNGDLLFLLYEARTRDPLPDGAVGMSRLRGTKTQMILNIENPDIIPSLRKVLGQLKGVSVVQTSRTKTAKSEKEEILQDIREAYTEVLEAQKTGKELPRLEDLLKEYEVE